jgi:hypothetical protein
MDTEFDLPSWDECEAACGKGNPTALQRFIYDCEPSSYVEEREFRDGLSAVIQEAIRGDDRLAKLEEDHSNLCRFVTGFDSMTGYYNG